MAPLQSSVLVVGASGFIGKHLVRRLLDEGFQVETWSRTPVELAGGTSKESFGEKLVHRSVDVLAKQPLPEPPSGGWDYVFQFAGESRPSRFVGHQHLRDTVRIAGRVANHVARVSAGCRYFQNSSAYVYAPTTEACTEQFRTEPTGPYGLAKLLTEDVTLLQGERLHITIVRPFNLIGAGLPKGLFATDLVERLRTGSGALTIPSPDSQRDLLDIRDAMDGYVALLSTDYASGTVFNFCSGEATYASQLAEALLLELDSRRLIRFEGAAGAPLIGSSARLRSVTGWAPRYDLTEIARSLLGAP